MKRLAIVVPCYNEEEILTSTAEQLTQILSLLINKKKISNDSYILFVDDGSTDRTWDIMKEIYNGNQFVCVLGLAGNAGQQNALMAGFAAAADNCDIAVSIDADLQDDIGVMEQMIDKYYQGADVVYGVRNDRTTDTVFKRSSANLFYFLMKKLGTNTVINHADYRLMSAEVLHELMRYGEHNIFIRGIIPMMGFQSDVVYYARKRRTAGKTKYSLAKMISTAFEAITSFCIKPVTLIMFLGTLIAICALTVLLVLSVCAACGIHVSDGKIILSSVWLLGGIQLAAIGVIGQYVGRTHFETKQRPRYRIRQMLIRGSLSSNREDCCRREEN